MADCRLYPRARGDLDDVWPYSVALWGEDQAEKYLRGIQRALDEISRALQSSPAARASAVVAPSNALRCRGFAFVALRGQR